MPLTEAMLKGVSMKRIILLISTLLLLASGASAQVSRIWIREGTTLPASCSNRTVLFHLRQVDGSNQPGIYRCDGTNFVNAGGVSSSRTINTTSPITGGGDLSANRTIACATCTTDANTQTLTNKTFDTAGTGNSFSINGVAATANTGTGAVARAVSPSFTTPTLGAALATSLNGNTFTSGSYTITGGAGKTLTFNHSLTLIGTDGTSHTFPATTSTLARTDAAQTFTGNQTHAGDILAAADGARSIGASSSGRFNIYGYCIGVAGGGCVAAEVRIGGAGAALQILNGAVRIGHQATIEFALGDPTITASDAGIYRRGAATLEVTTGAGSVGTLGKLLAGRVVTAKTTSYTVVTADKSTFFTNTGAGGAIVYTLPTPASGMTVEFYRDANQTVTIDVAAGVTIRVGASVTTDGGDVTLDAVGSRIRLVAISTTQWVGEVTGAATFN